VVFSIDGHKIAGTVDDELVIYSSAQGILEGVVTILGVQHSDTSLYTSQSFSVDGSMLATSRDDGIVKLFDASTGQLLRIIERVLFGERDFRRSIAWGPDWVTVTQSWDS
jgi:WD40 repeat protein